jgi:hypothetical protein
VQYTSSLAVVFPIGVAGREPKRAIDSETSSEVERALSGRQALRNTTNAQAEQSAAKTPSQGPNVSIDTGGWYARALRRR